MDKKLKRGAEVSFDGGRWGEVTYVNRGTGFLWVLDEDGDEVELTEARVDAVTS
jgi:preprotein translocase subunit YajC|tara:strand:+ start:100 stop:261 length:162 start_codon:yes stop_codon:yes gene_type:complete